MSRAKRREARGPRASGERCERRHESGTRGATAARILGRLSRAGHFMRALSAQDSDGCRLYGLFASSGQAALMTVLAATVEHWLSEGFVKKAGDCVVLTRSGAAWLRRQRSVAHPFMAQHQARTMSSIMKEDTGVRIPVLLNEAESPLAWLHRRKGRDGRPIIDAAQFAAGERLRSDFERARMTPRVTSDWGALLNDRQSRRGATDGMARASDGALQAADRVRRALESVGPEFSGVLLDVCCHLTGLEVAERARNWPRRSGKVILGLGLSRLARHYGLLAGSFEVLGRSRIRQWGAEDYRPSIEADGEEGAQR